MCWLDEHLGLFLLLRSVVELVLYTRLVLTQETCLSLPLLLRCWDERGRQPLTTTWLGFVSFGVISFAI